MLWMVVRWAAPNRCALQLLALLFITSMLTNPYRRLSRTPGRLIYHPGGLRLSTHTLLLTPSRQESHSCMPVEHIISTDVDFADLLLAWAPHALPEDGDGPPDSSCLPSNNNGLHLFHPPPSECYPHAFMHPLPAVSSMSTAAPTSAKPAAPPTPAPAMLAGSKHVSKSVQRHRRAGKKACVARQKLNEGVEALSYKLWSFLSKKYAKSQTIFIKTSIQNLQCANGGYVGLPLKEKLFTGRYLTLEELKAKGFTYVPWDGW